MKNEAAAFGLLLSIVTYFVTNKHTICHIRMIRKILTATFYFVAMISVAKSQPKTERYIPEVYVPSSLELYNTIINLDSTYFDTYNTCKLAKMDSLTSDDLEFYHDRTGLSTSKKDFMKSIQNNICGKVTRTLTKGSIEVYSIAGYGAVEIGYHSFRSINEKGESHPSKFIILWRLKDERWQLTRVISLH